MTSRSFGLAVVGAGRMGTHRARLAAARPAVDFLAISDLDQAWTRGGTDRPGSPAQLIGAGSSHPCARSSSIASSMQVTP